MPKQEERPPDRITETPVHIRFTDAKIASSSWVAEVNLGQSVFQEHPHEFLAVDLNGSGDAWFMTRDEAIRFHAWLGSRLKEKC